ncbi:MAG: putative lipid II flippase FtsW [Candidatus Methylacidiphilales bacterium]|nr:putative lipid II flippase FtsW [Candidatus Methylacidiphilales bacterium]
MARNSAYFLLIAVLGLVSLGLVMLSSVSAFAPANNGDQAFFLKRQAAALAAGVVVCVLLAKWDYRHWTRYAWWIVGVASLLMLSCFVPGLGVKVKGASRWIDLGPMNFQPVEMLKLSVVVFMGWWLGLHQKTVSRFQDGFAIPMGVLALAIGLCILQKDLGTSAILVLLSFILMFVAGTRWQFIVPVPVLGLVGILVLALTMPERRTRLLAFLDPEGHKEDAGYQVWQALIAFGSGGLSGRGLGEGVQKMFYLPEAHNDFIFPIIGEELGLIFTLGVVLFFLFFALSGGMIACHAPDATGLLLGIGITCAICLQAALNIAVVTAMVPAKGIGLPFISYGGSNLLLCLAGVGILLNIHSNSAFKPRRHRSVLPAAQSARM